MKNLYKKIVFCVLAITLTLSGVFVNMFSRLNGKTFAEEINTNQNSESNISIFIRKPTYSVFYNNKLYFIDDGDKLLKIYNPDLSLFESNYLDVSAYDIIETSFVDKFLFLLVSDDSNNKIVKINLETLEIYDEYSIEIASYYKTLFVQEVTFDENKYYLVTYSARGYNIIASLINVSDNSSDTFEVKFKTDDSLQSSIKTNLKKTVSYQDSSNRLYLVFIYNFSIAYYLISSYTDLTDLKTKEIVSINHTEIPQDDPELTFNDSLIIDVGFATIKNKSYLAISYNTPSRNNEIIKLYSFKLESGTDTITYSTQFPCINSKYIIFNKNYYSYVDDIEQKLYFTQVDNKGTADEPNFTGETNVIDNPNYNINYLSVDNFVYKKAKKLTELFEDPWGANSTILVSKDYNIIKIGSAVLDNGTSISDYDYCLFTNENTNYCGFIKTIDLEEKQQISVAEAGYKPRVSVWPKTTLYSLPTTVLKGKIGNEDCLLVSKKLLEIEDNSELEVLDILCDYTANNTKMLKVKVNGNEIGYIEAKCVRNPANVVDFVITNATIKKDNTTVYLSPKSDATTLTFKLNAGKNVRINGNRNTKTGFTSITFNDEYGNEFTGYIATDYIKADAWSTLQIVGCILIAINIGLLILILLYKKNHLGSRGQKIDDKTINEIIEEK